MKTCTQYFAAVVLASSVLVAAELRHQDWHRSEREYREDESVVMRVVRFDAVRKIRVGMTFAEVTKITGVEPTNHPNHPAYAILATRVDGRPCEVALLHRGGRAVQALSYRVWESKEPNKASAPARRTP